MKRRQYAVEFVRPVKINESQKLCYMFRALRKRRPPQFGNVLLQDGRPGILSPLIVDSSKVPVRFYIDQGLYQDGLSSQRNLRDLLQAKDYEVTYRETGAANEPIHWAATLAEGLIALPGQPTR